MSIGRPGLLLLTVLCSCDSSATSPAPTSDSPVASTTPSSAAVPSAPRDDEARRIEHSRALVQRFASALQQELMQGLSQGGPANAIAVCSDKAPHIATQMGLDDGWSIGRTALKLRNPANAPDSWERAVLERFEKERAAGSPVDDLETHEIVTDNGKPVFRYMKAIVTQPLCLTCHGASVPPEVARELGRRYPQDRARGFSVGDIRGAFSVKRTL